MSYIVTGGCGFIGSNFVNQLASTTDKHIIVLDKLTYAADATFIDKSLIQSNQVIITEIDIAKDTSTIDDIFNYNNIEGVFNFAAESHVDNSISDPDIFIQSNVTGTFNILEACRKYDTSRFLQVSTDEVYGSLQNYESSFTELTNLDPSSVYSASKGAADLLVNAYHKTYKLNTVITRCCNNYGPHQHSEKLIPKVILNALNDRPIPVYGKGDNVREWIHVIDHCTAIKLAYDHGVSGEVYNIGSGIEDKNIHLVKRVLKVLNKSAKLITFVTDRKGHDLRYSIDSSKFIKLVGSKWTIRYPEEKFNEGLGQTAEWLRNKYLS